MGKVVKAVAGVIGIAAIVIPGVGAAISGAMGALFSGTAIGGGVTAFGFGAAQAVSAALMMQGVAFGSPVADMVPDTSTRFNSAISRSLVIECMMPIRRRWHFLRFRLGRITGRCMEPHVPNGRYLLIDRAVDIRAGDLVVVRTDSGSVMKRFVRLDGDGLVVETTSPMTQRYFIPLNKVKSAYRARASGASRKDALRAIMAIKRNADAHNEMLANIRPPKGMALI